MTRVPVPPHEPGIEHVREQDSDEERGYWGAAPQRLLDYVAEYVEGRTAHPARPAGVARPRLAEDVRRAREAWIGRMTTFSLRSVLDLLRGVPPQSHDPRLVRLVVAARAVCYDSESQLKGGHELDRALEAFAQEIPWDEEREETPA